MNYRVTLCVGGSPAESDALRRSLEAEQHRMKKAHYIVGKEEGQVVLEFFAEDAESLKVALNSMAKLLATFEKTAAL